ncbi:hypothetical protein BDL97_18G101000 [Sphagnum fallax]|nr:hypothetical protein BDL97_18G101000 [Sphagnum fallax]
MDFFGRLPWELQPGASLVKRSPLPLMVDKLAICALLRERVLEHWSTAVWKDRVSERSPPLSLSCCTVLWQSASAGFQKQFENGLHAVGREVTSC